MAKPPYTTGFRKGHVPRRHQRILRVLITGAPDLWALSICQLADVGTGSAYPLLARMERLGWLTSAWEGCWPAHRPRRRLYALTPEGRENVARLLGMEAGDGR